jgi:hypothetical protein
MNPVTVAMATFLDNLTGGSLDYKSAHPDGDSRAQAGARLFEHEDAIQELGTPGLYRVKSRTDGRVWYRVHAIGPDLSCECEDHRAHAPHICAHIIAAVWHFALGQALAEQIERDAWNEARAELAAEMDTTEEEIERIFGPAA